MLNLIRLYFLSLFVEIYQSSPTQKNAGNGSHSVARIFSPISITVYKISPENHP